MGGVQRQSMRAETHRKDLYDAVAFEQRLGRGLIFGFKTLLLSRLRVLTIVRSVRSPIENESLFHASTFLVGNVE